MIVDKTKLRVSRGRYTVLAKQIQRARAHEDHHEIESLRIEQRAVSQRVAYTLGHLPLRQRISVECSRCGASGIADDLEMRGDVFWKECEA